MKRVFYILIIFSFLIPQGLLAQSLADCSDVVDLSWVKTAGSSIQDAANGIAVDNYGNIIVTGYFKDILTFETETATSIGEKDFFIAKTDSEGNLIWLKTGGGSDNDYGKSVAVDDQNNIFVLGSFSGNQSYYGEDFEPSGSTDIFLIKLSSNGDFQNKQFLGGWDFDTPGDIFIDNNNNVVISGTFYQYLGVATGTIIGHGENNDFFIAKYDNLLDNLLWFQSNGSTSDETGVGVTCDQNANIFVTGEFGGTMDFPSISISPTGSSDVFLAKYNSSGVFQWVKSSQTAGDYDIASNVATDFNGNSYVLYKADQTTDMERVDKYSPSGSLILGLGFGGNGIIFPKDIVVDNSESIYITGMYYGITNFGDGNINSVGQSDYFISKYNSDGSLNYKDIAGSSNNDCGNGICLDAHNNMIVGGYYNDLINFETGIESSHGSDDIMILKYDRYISFGEILISSQNCAPDDMCVDITVLGGTPPLSFLWSDGQTDEDVCGLTAGTVSVTVTDFNDCFIETTIELIAPVPPVIALPASVLGCPFDPYTIDAGAGNYSYLWSTGEDTQTIELVDEDTYSVTVTDLTSGCKSSASTIFIRQPNHALFAEDTVYVCYFDVIPLTLLPGFSVIEWSDGSTAQQLITGVEDLFFVRAWSSVTNCEYFDSIRVLHFPKPTINQIQDQLFCIGDSIEIIANDGFENYLWNNGQTTQNIWVSLDAIVMVTVTDINGCEIADTISVSSMTTPVVYLGQDSTYCTNSPLLLDPNDLGVDNIYLWNNGSHSPTISVSTSGLYWVEVSNLAGCMAKDTIELIFYPQPTIYLGPDITFCDGDSREIIADDGYISYLWNDGTTDNFVTATATGIISVTVTDENLCFDSDTILITENMMPVPFMGLDTVLCVGNTYTLGPENQYQYYNWNTGSHSSSISVTVPGFYSLTVSDNIGCSASSSLNISFEEGPSIVSVNSGGGIISINATGGTPPLMYSYDGDTWLNSNVIAGLESDTYTIWVMDENYCIVTIETFLDESINIPAFFTPNNDGYNDNWVITGLYHYPNAEVEIFDRFGKKLYQFAGSDFGWNGTYMGLPLPSDTYWYTIRLRDDIDPLKGHVTIKR